MIVTNGVGAPTTLEEASIGVNTGTGSRISLNGIRPLPVSPWCQTGPGYLLSTSWGRVPETRAVATPACQLPQAELDFRRANACFRAETPRPQSLQLHSSEPMPLQGTSHALQRMAMQLLQMHDESLHLEVLSLSPTSMLAQELKS